MDRREWEAGLDEALLGGREKPQIVIANCDPCRPARFELERTRVHDALGDVALRIEPSGSTAVPGWAAKPIIDLLVTAEDPDDHAVTVPATQSAGYELRLQEPGHRMFRTPARDAHIHVLKSTSSEVPRYLAFQDQLRRSIEDRPANERLKRDLATGDWTNMNAYAFAKDDLIEAILAKAATRSQSPPRALTETERFDPTLSRPLLFH